MMSLRTVRFISSVNFRQCRLAFISLSYFFWASCHRYRWSPRISQFLRISRLTVPVLTPITSPISLKLIGVCSNTSIVYRCSLVKCLYPILCRFSGYGSKVILSRFKAVHFRTESSCRRSEKKGGTGDGRVRDLLISVAGSPGKNRPATEGRWTCSERTGDLRRKNGGPAAKKRRTGDGRPCSGRTGDLRHKTSADRE